MIRNVTVPLASPSCFRDETQIVSSASDGTSIMELIEPHPERRQSRTKPTEYLVTADRPFRC
jgi:hypothetical protein